MDYEAALERAIDGQAVLFLGAGFSRDAKNIAGSSLKIGTELAQYLANKAGLPPDTGLEDAAEEFLEEFGEDTLIQELQREFTASKVDSSQVVVARLPWKRIYTTNYDNVIESAYAENSRPIIPVVLSDNPRDIPKTDTLAVHLNGYAKRLSRESLGSELKLTGVSYVTASIADSEWVSLLRQDLKFARSVFFLGFSLADLDIKRILFATDELQDKCFFVVGNNPDASTVRRVKHFGSLLRVDTRKFAFDVREKLKVYSPPEVPLPLGSCVELYAEPEKEEEVSDKDIFDLLALGRISESKAWGALRDGQHYLLLRERAEPVLGYLKVDDQVLVIYSDFANGKTLFLDGLKYLALRQGYEVFTVVDRSEDVFRELELAFERKGPLLFIIDDYPDALDVVRFFSLNAPSNARLVLSARSLSHDVLIDDILDALQEDEVTEIGIDKLSDSEIDWVVDLLDEYGLWGERAAWSRTRKTRLLTGKCRSEFHAILLETLEAPQIVDRLRSMMVQVRKHGQRYRMVLSVLILAVLNHRPDLNKLADFWGVREVNGPHFKKNQAVRQLVDFRRDEVLMRSSVASQYILREIADAGVVAETLREMARAADRLRKISREHYSLAKQLMRFGNIQQVFPEKGRRPAVIGYYEAIKSLGICQRNPLFWFQYAIACIVLEEFPRAAKYFETAYSLARDRDWDTYQIDNHYARYLLVEVIHSRDSERAMASFRKARNIINNQVKDERKHYPYRVARSYEKFFDVFEGELTGAQLEEVAKASSYLLGRIKRLPEDRRAQFYVRECESALEYVVERYAEIFGGEDGEDGKGPREELG